MPENQIHDEQPQPNRLPEAKGETAPGIPDSGSLRIQVNEAARESLEINLSGTEGFIIGRSDNKSSYRPDIDLAVHSALEKGVSRRHAAFVRYQGMLHILDLSSVNGTFLNGNRLTPELAYQLNPGDKVTLGDLHLLLSLPPP